MPPSTTPSAPAASPDAALEHFIFGHDPFFSESVPRGLDPAEVARFIRTRIDRSTDLHALRQAEKVIDFYDLVGVADLFKSYLDRKEVTGEEVHRALLFARIVARVGRPAEVDVALDYYPYLAQRCTAPAQFADLIGLYEALGPAADPKIAREPIERRLKVLDATRQTSPAAQYEHQELTDLLKYKLRGAEQANATKAAVLKTKSRAARIDEEIKMYLAVQYGYLEYLQPWGARRLRREAWAEQPADQIEPQSDPARRQELVDGFRRALAHIEKGWKLHPEEQHHAKVRSLRAIEFFGGTLTPEEEQFLRDKAADQMDALSIS